MIEIALLTALLLHSVFVAFRLRDAERHDAVLFRFCEIRRRLVALIFDRDMSGAMSRDEYRTACQLLDMLGRVIGEYHRRRAGMFNFRAFRRFLRDYEKTAGELESVLPPENPELRALYEQTARALVVAFFAYTPFLRSEIVLRLFLRLGVAFFKEKTADFARPLRDAERFGVKIGDNAMA